MLDRNKEFGFTLVELSIVIAIIAVLVVSLSVGISIINQTRVTSIFRDASAYKKAIESFYDSYGCLAGDCTYNDIKILLDKPASGSLKTTCATSSASMVLNTEKIDTISKNSCLFWELAVSGFIDNWSGIPETLTPSVINAGRTNPFVRSLSDGIWYASTFNSPFKDHAFRGASEEMTNALVIISDSSSSPASNAVGALDVKIARNIDIKFDDGSPNGGIWVSSRDDTSLSNGMVCVANKTLSLNASFTLPASPSDLIYNPSDNDVAPCISQILIPALS